MTKQMLIASITDAVKVYGREQLGSSLYYQFTSIGFYMEDKRRSKVNFAVGCISNCYKDIPSNYMEVENNKEIESAVITALEFCERQRT